MDITTKYKPIGEGLIPHLWVEIPRIKNGFNHLSLQHNLPNRHRIILRINQPTQSSFLPFLADRYRQEEKINQYL